MNVFFLRLFVGIFMFTFHGYPKLANFNEIISKFPDPLGWGGELSFLLVTFAESACSILLISGTFFRLACIPLLFAMYVITFIFHGNDPISYAETPLLYFIIFLFLFLNGPGKYALRFNFNMVKNNTLRWLLG